MALDGHESVAGLSLVWPIDGRAGDPLRVWRIDLTAFHAPGLDWHVLSDAERERAGTFREPPAAARFVAGRVALRLVLARCLDVAPREVRLVNGPFGRPELASGYPFFSLSKSRDIGVVAVSLDAPVGADVEATLRENLQAGAVPGGRSLREWTHTEAVLKALGFGLAVDPDRLEIRHIAGAGPQVRLDDRTLPVRRLLEVDVGPGYVACVAEIGDTTAPLQRR